MHHADAPHEVAAAVVPPRDMGQLLGQDVDIRRDWPAWPQGETSAHIEGVGQVYVVGSDWNSDFVQVSSNELRLNGGGRIYFAKDASDGVYPDLYWQVSLGLVLN